MHVLLQQPQTTTAMTIDTDPNHDLAHPDTAGRCSVQAGRFARGTLAAQARFADMAVTAPHWQLKDMLVVAKHADSVANYTSNGDPHVYFPYKNKIFSFKMSERSHDAVSITSESSAKQLRLSAQNTIRLHTSPRCLQQLDDIVVAGGVNGVGAPLTPIGLHKGSFSVHNSSTRITENVQVGEFINNCVTINKSTTSANSHYVSYLCNNDKYLHRYDITPSEIIQGASPVYLNVALNHAVMSNDNKTLITVGDTSNIYLAHPNEEPLRKVSDFTSIQTDGDCGFSTCFLPNGREFLTCFQDGVAMVYDLRKSCLPMHKIYSTRPKTQPGAFRVAKTTNNNDDLVFISEHQGRVHMIDTRDFSNHSVILLPKYLYNVPPSMTDAYHNEDDSDDERVGEPKHPISVSTIPNENGHWFNQPVVKDIREFEDLDHFGGDLHMGYLESYKFLDSRYANTMYNNNQSPPVSTSQINPYKILLQGSFDREELIRRKATPGYTANNARLLTYLRPLEYPLQHKNGVTRLCKDMWWNKDTQDTTYWPWNKTTMATGDDIPFMETPMRDPFFYVDSDIEINGMDVAFRNGSCTLCIGTKEGIVFWDINSNYRSCFPLFDCE